MDRKETSRLYERQRRNLILISVLLFGIIVTGVTIKELNLVFVKLHNPNHDYIFLFIWVIFCYFIIRYNQFLRIVGYDNMGKNIKDLTNTMIANKISNESDILKIENLDKEPFINTYNNYLRLCSVMNARQINANVSELKINISIVGYADKGQSRAISEEQITEVIDYRQYKLIYLKAWIRNAFIGHHYFEYILPNLIAVATYSLSIPELWRIVN